MGPFFFSRTFDIDRLVLVQIEGHMTEKKKARKYRAVVNDLKLGCSRSRLQIVRP